MPDCSFAAAPIYHATWWPIIQVVVGWRRKREKEDVMLARALQGDSKVPDTFVFVISSKSFRVKKQY
jgi:hypothetical protein